MICVYDQTIKEPLSNNNKTVKRKTDKDDALKLTLMAVMDELVPTHVLTASSDSFVSGKN